jgi:O-antigen ligase
MPAAQLSPSTIGHRACAVNQPSGETDAAGLPLLKLLSRRSSVPPVSLATALRFSNEWTMIPRRSVERGLTNLVVFGVFYNNILRWYPFPAGRSANDFITLEDNFLGIAVNVALYACILLLTFFDRRSFRIPSFAVPLYLYSAYIALQAPFRPDPTMELVRSLGIVAMMLSASRLAVLLGTDPEFLDHFVKRLWGALASTLFLGVVVGILKSNSVNWGSGRSPAFEQLDRAEFFFFHLLPYPTVALSLAVLSGPRRWRSASSALALVSLALTFALALMTMTRSIIFSCLLVAVAFLLQRSRPWFFAAAAAAIVAALLLPALTRDLAVQTRLNAEEDMDFTTHRATLVALNIEMFLESPLFGLGAQEARRRIQASESIAKTEHGYAIHFSSYGLFALLFIGHVLFSLSVSLRMIWERRSIPRLTPEIKGLRAAFAASAIATAGLGLVWLFGSGSAFYDWMGLFVLSLAPVLWRTPSMGAQASAPAALSS